MSFRETPMVHWYWNRVGGTLIEEFRAVRRGPNQGQRLLDGLIILGQEKRRANPGERVDITGKDVVVLQAKNSRLGMYLMGQTFFSKQLVMNLNARDVKSIALCAQNDDVLGPMLEACEGCKVEVCPPEVCQVMQR